MGEAEIITRRRKWTPEQKAALLAEVAAEGGRVAMMARRHSLSESLLYKSLLYNWRSVAKAAVSMHAPEPMEFRPIGVIGRTTEAAQVLLAAPDRRSPTGGGREVRIGKIEIARPNGMRVTIGNIGQ